MSPVMARCPCGWPVADCLEHAPPRDPDPGGLCLGETPPTAVAVTIGAIAGVGYVALGATLILLGRAAWHAARALVGHQ